ncbi:type III-A CRISPR-associated protein Csm2 [Anaerobranca gottschalkii]|uniref:CRISPR system Cms protein Csm2 n=1 Tax=Anaerobranca gottschalkii DSM 13577 TaxID=1120990 RepID=A0A1I0A9P1_9FIRM|nr:type III-A CRISPR-associated protein Csm2 [Anaerobranca gottschalkii]SES90741.1 CRISPR type III-A/MTUBE-associated protein Csm2 [Anaerobranca gottschalkii DSM 13577]
MKGYQKPYKQKNYNHNRNKQQKNKENNEKINKLKDLTEYFEKNVLVLNEKSQEYDTFCDKVKEYANELKDLEVTTSMIRKIYARIMNANTILDLKKLRPLFAYTAGKEKKTKAFMELLDKLVKNMDFDKEQVQLRNFKDFMEGIVAYRKYVGEDKDDLKQREV